MLVSGPGTRFAKGWCLETHDLVLSKYVAGRDKDHRFIRAAIDTGYVRREVLGSRSPTLAVSEEERRRIETRMAHDFGYRAG